MLDIPQRFWDVAYNGRHFPGARGTNGLEGGVNCQQFAFELLRHYGLMVPNFRSSTLWNDEKFTERVNALRPLDLLLFNKTADAHGAHIAVYIGDDRAIHLCKALGRPAIWTRGEFLAVPRYAVFIGAKRATSAVH